jgi:hypothetical protein
MICHRSCSIGGYGQFAMTGQSCTWLQYPADVYMYIYNIYLYTHIHGSVPIIAIIGSIPVRIGQPPWSKHAANMAETRPMHGPNMAHT